MHHDNSQNVLVFRRSRYQCLHVIGLGIATYSMRSIQTQEGVTFFKELPQNREVIICGYRVCGCVDQRNFLKLAYEFVVLIDILSVLLFQHSLDCNRK